jgi:hypothetical protein
MPTAVEYALVKHWHAQNGCGSGPPAVTVLHHDAAPHGHVQAAVLQPMLPSSTPSGELLLTGPLTALLLIATAVSTARRRAPRPRPARSRH